MAYAGMVVSAVCFAAAIYLSPSLSEAFGITTAGAAKTFVGRATVIDGDTVEIHSRRIRLNGIDAPESGQDCLDAAGRNNRCGRVSAEALDRLLAASRPLRCEIVARDRYHRFVANCFLKDGRNVAAWLVRNGHALDWPKYSNGRFAAEQTKARAAGRGIWAGSFELPWEWRRERRGKELHRSNNGVLPSKGSRAMARQPARRTAVIRYACLM